MLTAFSAWEDPVYLWAQWRSSFSCSLGSRRFAALTPPPSVHCFAPFIPPLFLRTALHSLEMFSLALPVSSQGITPGGVGKGTGYRAACRAEEDHALFPWLQRALHFFFFQAVQSHRCPAASLHYALLLEAMCHCFGAGYPFLCQSLWENGFWGRTRCASQAFRKRSCASLNTSCNGETSLSEEVFRVWFKWRAKLGSKKLCRLAETGGNLCRSLDSALCMLSSVLQPSPMAGEMFPWWIQCSIS